METWRTYKYRIRWKSPCLNHFKVPTYSTLFTFKEKIFLVLVIFRYLTYSSYAYHKNPEENRFTQEINDNKMSLFIVSLFPEMRYISQTDLVNITFIWLFFFSAYLSHFWCLRICKQKIDIGNLLLVVIYNIDSFSLSSFADFVINKSYVYNLKKYSFLESWEQFLTHINI